MMAKRKRASPKGKAQARYLAHGSAAFTDEKAEELGAWIDSHGGYVTPQQLVDEARDESSPFHELFEWDDEKAGESFRRLQAANHIRHVQVEIIGVEETRTRACHPVFMETQGGGARRVYVKVSNLTQEQQDQVIQRAHQQLLSWRRKHSEYKRIFRDIFKAIDNLKEI